MPRGRRNCEIRREQRHGGAAPARFLRQRHTHPSGGAIPEEPDCVERLASPTCGDQHTASGERIGLTQQFAAAAEDLIRFHHPAHAPLALGRLALVRADKHGAARPNRFDVRLGGRARPHARIHRRCQEDRPAVRQRRFADEIVREAVRELGERIRRQRRDNQQVGLCQMNVEVLGGALPGQRKEGLRSDKTLRPRCDQRDDLVARLHEQADQVASLVGRDSPRDSHQHPSHAGILPFWQRRQQIRERLFRVLVLELALGDFLEGHGQVVLRA